MVERLLWDIPWDVPVRDRWQHSSTSCTDVAEVVEVGEMEVNLVSFPCALELEWELPLSLKFPLRRYRPDFDRALRIAS